MFLIGYSLSICKLLIYNFIKKGIRFVFFIFLDIRSSSDVFSSLTLGLALMSALTSVLLCVLFTALNYELKI